MNIPRTIETAIAEALRGFGIGDVTLIRCWHGLTGDYKWASETDRTMPCIDVRCGPPKTSEENRVTQSVTAEIVICTDAHDDMDHAQMCGYEEAVQGALDTLYLQFYNGQGGDLLNAFQTIITTDCPVIPAIADLVQGEPVTPYNDDGISKIGLSLIVHFARTDFL